MNTNGIHAIQTGVVAVKQRFLVRQGGEITSKLRALLDRSFTAPLPIYCWLIEHDEGTFLIDAGMSDKASQPGYVETAFGPFDAWLSHRICRFFVQPGEGLGPQLQKARPRNPADLRIVLTHLHSDHISGLADLQSPAIIVNRAEWEHPYGAPKRLLQNARPILFDLKPDASLPFGASYPLTRAGDLFVVPTPGHTPHHCSVVLRRGGVTYFFAGDISYSQDQLLRGEIAGGHAKAEAAAETMEKIRAFAQREPCVFLPSHDPLSEQRLRTKDQLRA
jgi:N-acyl homoserine lactone hydrolase